MIKTKAIIVAALCTAGLFAAPAAFAAARTQTTEVHYKDLDLATSEGQQALNARIAKAARDVCRVNVPTTGTHLTSTVDRSCYREALANVRERVATVIDKADDTRLGG